MYVFLISDDQKTSANIDLVAMIEIPPCHCFTSELKFKAAVLMNG